MNHYIAKNDKVDGDGCRRRRKLGRLVRNFPSGDDGEDLLMEIELGENET